MLWLITLLVLALAAFVIVKSMKSSTQKRQAEHNALQDKRLESESPPSLAVTTSDDVLADSNGAASITQQTGSITAVAATVGVTAHTSDSPSTDSSNAIHTGDTLADVREMIKILNLDGPDASRLAISRDELTALRKGETSGVPDATTLETAASKLRQMLA